MCLLCWGVLDIMHSLQDLVLTEGLKAIKIPQTLEQLAAVPFLLQCRKTRLETTFAITAMKNGVIGDNSHYLQCTVDLSKRFGFSGLEVRRIQVMSIEQRGKR